MKYNGWDISDNASVSEVKGFSGYVVKVDQAVKGRFKKGLVSLDVIQPEILSIIKKYRAQGYDHFIVEPYVLHENSKERYMTISLDRKGLSLSYSAQGGVDIESNPETIKSQYITPEADWKVISKQTALTVSQLHELIEAFKVNHFVFLEINPYIETDQGLSFLDLAVEIDDAGQGLVSSWTGDDIRQPKKTTWPEEEVVHQLDKGSVASFNLSVINPHGSIFLLLSGGGASVVIADEVFNRGMGAQLANYGEYSGNPEAHEAQKYTSEVLELLLASDAPSKVLFIGGAVANFTDIATTFAGVIAAIDERAEELAQHNVKAYVRRGGPRQELGLKNIREALEKHSILGGIYSPSTTIVDALGFALEGLHK
jgi:ATP-citrate lyase beta-subunit